MQYGDKNWVLYKRYSEFNDLYKILKKLYNNLPDFPKKTFFAVKDEHTLI